MFRGTCDPLRGEKSQPGLSRAATHTGSASSSRAPECGKKELSSEGKERQARSPREPRHRADPLPEEPDEGAQQPGSTYPSRWHSGQVSRPKAALPLWQAPHCLPRSIAV
jgi:hypothetical protein